MSLKSLFQHAFFQGCGIPMSKALMSPMYRELRGSYLATSGLQEGSDQMRALRLGHLLFGGIMNIMMSEEETLRELPKRPEAGELPVGLRAQIDLLGHELVNVAQGVLPPEVKVLAAEWKTASAKRQVEILPLVARTLKDFHRENRVRGDLSKEDPTISSGGLFWDYVNQNPNRFLPAKFAKSEYPNCLGMAQLLVAFGRLCEARTFLATPVSAVTSVCHRKLRRLLSQILLECLRLRYVTEEQGGNLFAATRLAIAQEELWLTLFHSAIVLQLQDGSWVMLDPYLDVCGPLPQSYRLSEVGATLEKYRWVLPGLSLLSTDCGIGERHATELFEQISAQVQNCAERGEKFRDAAILFSQSIGESWSVADLIRIFEHSELFSSIFTILQPTDKELENAGGISNFAGNVLVGTGEGSLERFANDLDYFSQRMFQVLSAPAMQLRQDFAIAFTQRTRGGGISHPVCEVRVPEYGLAMHVLNDLAIDMRINGRELRPLHYEWFGQLSLRNLIAFERSKIAEDIASNLPRHPALSRWIKITSAESRAEEGGGDA